MTSFSQLFNLSLSSFSGVFNLPLTQYEQAYYSLSVYFFLAVALCGLLAGLAYLFSISTSQETEKRSEYECGFAPFDSATRLPFDVHFYLVGILFLIFDVEVALLFPWVLSLRTVGWFGFYVMMGFIAVLSIGFLYEWKRGALIWPTKFAKAYGFGSASYEEWVFPHVGVFKHLLFFLDTTFGRTILCVFVLHRMALLYTRLLHSTHIKRNGRFGMLLMVACGLFFLSLKLSYFLAAALVLTYGVSSFLERNPFFAPKMYWTVRAAFIGTVVVFLAGEHRILPRMFKYFFWGLVAWFVFIAAETYFAHKYLGTRRFIRRRYKRHTTARMLSYITVPVYWTQAYSKGKLVVGGVTLSILTTLTDVVFWPFQSGTMSESLAKTLIFINVYMILFAVVFRLPPLSKFFFISRSGIPLRWAKVLLACYGPVALCRNPVALWVPALVYGGLTYVFYVLSEFLAGCYNQLMQFIAFVYGLPSLCASYANEFYDVARFIIDHRGELFAAAMFLLLYLRSLNFRRNLLFNASLLEYIVYIIFFFAYAYLAFPYDMYLWIHRGLSRLESAVIRRFSSARSLVHRVVSSVVALLCYMTGKKTTASSSTTPASAPKQITMRVLPFGTPLTGDDWWELAGTYDADSLWCALDEASSAVFPLLGEILLFTAICVIIWAMSFGLGHNANKRSLARHCWHTVRLAFALTLAVYAYQFCYYYDDSLLLGGYFAFSRAIILVKFLTLASALFVLDASGKYMREHRRHLLEFPVMVGLTTFFMVLLVGANHLMSAFFCLVGFSLGLYVLVIFDGDKKASREAALKYYYLSSLSSGLILYGILLIYSLTGRGQFDSLLQFFNGVYFTGSAVIALAVIFLLVGFFFKLSAFPGHLWAADVYEGSPAPITAFFMLPVKLAVLGVFMRMFTVAFAPLSAYWLPVVTVAVLVSIVWGAFAAAQEKKIRRFLAYASINQMGFLLMGLTTDSTSGQSAMLMYFVVYAVMTCGFLTIFLAARRQDGKDLVYMTDFRLLASKDWRIGWSLSIILFSMAGIPPLGGFFAKYWVLLHTFEQGLIAETAAGLATSLISTYYYLRIIKTLTFEKPEGGMPVSLTLTPRLQAQLIGAEAFLWTFGLFAPGFVALMYKLPGEGATFDYFWAEPLGLFDCILAFIEAR